MNHSSTEASAKAPKTYPSLADIAELINAAEYAREILSLVPAFGDSIGSRINKAQIGIAYNKLTTALRVVVKD